MFKSKLCKTVVRSSQNDSSMLEARKAGVVSKSSVIPEWCYRVSGSVAVYLVVAVAVVVALHLSPFTLPRLWASGPNFIAKQGQIRVAGQPANGQKTMTFRLYTAASGGSAVWTKTATNEVYCINGMFNYPLSTDNSGVKISDLDFANQQYYMTMQLENGAEMLPREPLAALPYTFCASTATNLRGNGHIRITGAGDHYISNGNVGIGKTDPVYKLDVYGNASIGTGGLAYLSSYLSAANASTSLTLNGTSNIARFIVGDGRGNYNQYVNSYHSGSGVFKYGATGWGARMLVSEGNFGFYTAPYGTAGSNLTWTNVLYISSYSCVGVGTETPQALLTVSPGPVTITTLFQVAGSTFTVLKNGNVGIGTEMPNYKLVVNEPTDAVNSTVAKFSNSGLVNAHSAYIYIGEIQVGNGFGISLYKDTSASGINSYASFGQHYGDAVENSLIVKKGGNVGIGTTNPGQKLDVNGYIHSSAGNCSGSDIRWKKNISAIETPLEKILALRGVKYEWRVDEFPNNGFDKGVQLGVIAQEVEKVLPELVHTDKEGYKSVSYEKITPVLIEAIKQLKAENDELRVRMKMLEEKIGR